MTTTITVTNEEQLRRAIKAVRNLHAGARLRCAVPTGSGPLRSPPALVWVCCCPTTSRSPRCLPSRNGAPVLSRSDGGVAGAGQLVLTSPPVRHWLHDRFQSP